MDAACASADIKYPADLNLGNNVREFTEEIIDKFPDWCYLEIIKYPK